mmetsp:Transcript_25769/g.29673  ORF Transcript_25769/g.29673 Transcript_25769/m.29673 type:complete len:203 (+) Transcript_25769:80-688(+)
MSFSRKSWLMLIEASRFLLSSGGITKLPMLWTDFSRSLEMLASSLETMWLDLLASFLAVSLLNWLRLTTDSLSKFCSLTNFVVFFRMISSYTSDFTKLEFLTICGGLRSSAERCAFRLAVMPFFSSSHETLFIPGCSSLFSLRTTEETEDCASISWFRSSISLLTWNLSSLIEFKMLERSVDLLSRSRSFFSFWFLSPRLLI